MKRKKITLDRTTLGVLSNTEKKNIVGGSAFETSLKITSPLTSIGSNCPPPTLTPKPTCDSIGPKISCLS